MAGTAAVLSMVDPCVAEMGLRYVARQPIVDIQGRPHGYELLYRRGEETEFSGDGEQATRTMLDNLVLFGPHRFTDGEPVFINCTSHTLTSELVSVAPPDSTVLEILENVAPTPSLVATCRGLKARGYRIALDDFRWTPGMGALVELADYIKVDFLLSDEEERREIVRRLHGRNVKLVAEKIETARAFEQAVQEGFVLFQGYYFCRPELIKKREIPPNLSAQAAMLRALEDGELDLSEMAHLVSQNPAMTYRLFHALHAVASDSRQEAQSVETALAVVGEEMVRKIVLLAAESSFCCEKSREALRKALVRAKFCEMGSNDANGDATEQYLLGLFSLLPAMLQVPMEDAIAKIGFRGPAREALMGSGNAEGVLLRWIERYERGERQACDSLAEDCGLDAGALHRQALEATIWADATLHPSGRQCKNYAMAAEA